MSSMVMYVATHIPFIVTIGQYDPLHRTLYIIQKPHPLIFVF